MNDTDRRMEAMLEAEATFLNERDRKIRETAEQLGIAPSEVTPAVLAIASVLVQLTVMINRENSALRRRVADLEERLGISQ